MAKTPFHPDAIPGGVPFHRGGPARPYEERDRADSIDEGDPDPIVPDPLVPGPNDATYEAYLAVMLRLLSAMQDETSAMYHKDRLDSYDAQSIYRHINGAGEAVKDAMRRMQQRDDDA